MKMRLLSTIPGRPPGTFSLVQTPSRTLALNMSYVHSQEQSTHHEDLSQGQAPSDNIHTRNIHHITSYLPVIKPIMMRHYEPASPLFFLLRQQSEVFLNLVRLEPRQPQQPAALTQHLYAWYLNRWHWEASPRKQPTAHLLVLQAATHLTSPNEKPAQPAQACVATVETHIHRRRPASRTL